MIIEQLSVFIENKSGRIYEVMQILGDANINVSALSIADTSDYGIIRLIISDPKTGTKLLKAQDFSVQITPVICCKVPNAPGGLKRMLAYLTQDNISIEYMYAFSIGEDASVVLRTEDCNKTIECLSKHKMGLMSTSEIYQV